VAALVDHAATAYGSEPIVSRILDRLSQVLVDAKEVLWNFRAEADDQTGQIHELAPVILDYIRMRLKEYPEQGGVVEVAELMLRFREGARVIRKTLHLLENQGYAAQTDFKDVWEIITPVQGPRHR
jgi:hypothetical protein